MWIIKLGYISVRRWKANRSIIGCKEKVSGIRKLSIPDVQVIILSKDSTLWHLIALRSNIQIRWNGKLVQCDVQFSISVSNGFPRDWIWEKSETGGITCAVHECHQKGPFQPVWVADGEDCANCPYSLVSGNLLCSKWTRSESLDFHWWQRLQMRPRVLIR